MINGENLLKECRKLSDTQLLSELRALASKERVEIVKVLARLAEMGRRELAQEKGYSSLFLFCVRELRYCEGTAYYRTKAAQACAKFPKLLELLESGELNVTATALLSEHLTFENHQGLIRQARGLSRRELERVLASLHPQEKPAERSRVIAVAKSAEAAISQAAEGAQSELSLGAAPKVELRMEHRFTVSDATEAKLARARELLSHKFPMGDVESIFDVALDALLDKIDPERQKIRERPNGKLRATREETRHIPNWVKREVCERDQGRCAYVSSDGLRCNERKFLQYDHVKPWSQGGRSDDPGNIRQACASHNQWLARRMRA